MAKIIGIDLGTGVSKMAIIEAGQPKVLENREGSKLTPSVVAITKNNERLVGILAKRQAITNPKNTIYSIKRLIGRRFSDSTVQGDKKLLPYEIRQSAEEGVDVKMGDKWYKPPEISAMILQKLKQDAEERLGEKITDAIITCPAYFDDSQRKATKVAGEIAGFNVRRVINEPTAAALAYGLIKKKGAQIIVYDLGSGTFDISILDVREDTVKVIATGGDTHLGGDDFDQKIIDWLIKEFRKDQGIDLSRDILALQRLKEAAEKAKVELSTTYETEINLPFVTSDASGPKHLLYKLSRSQFEEMIRPYIDRTIELVDKTLKEAKLKPADIEEMVLVGGPTRIPLVQEAVRKFFGKEPHRDLNPDEVVAMGAAIEGGVLAGEVRDILLLDVTPLSLGIETLGGINTVLITKNTTIPTAKTQIFSTAADSQTSVEIHVLQGERPMAQDNKTLGRFILDGIPPSPRGIPQIEVTFDIDANGILNVTAKDKATGRSQSVRIEGSTGLSKEEIEKLKKEAELHAKEDLTRRELSEAKNMADNLVYTSEKALREAGDKVSAEAKKEIEEKIEALKKVKDSDNIDEIKSKTTSLSQVIQKIGAEMYGQTGGQKPPEEGQGPSAEEGEYKEKR